MSLKRTVRRILLSLVLGWHGFLGIGMSREEIERLLSSMNETHVGVTVAESEKTNKGRRSW